MEEEIILMPKEIGLLIAQLLDYEVLYNIIMMENTSIIDLNQMLLDKASYKEVN